MRQNGHKFYKGYWRQEVLPTWDDILANLDDNFERDLFYKTLDNGGFVTHNGFDIPAVDKIGKEIQNYRPNDSLTAHIYVSLSKNSGTFGRHQDANHDVFFVQALGKSEWMVEDNGKENIYILEPGDMIYCAAGLFHTPRPLSPRVGLSFGFEY